MIEDEIIVARNKVHIQILYVSTNLYAMNQNNYFHSDIDASTPKPLLQYSEITPLSFPEKL